MYVIGHLAKFYTRDGPLEGTNEGLEFGSLIRSADRRIIKFRQYGSELSQIGMGGSCEDPPQRGS